MRALIVGAGRGALRHIDMPIGPRGPGTQEDMNLAQIRWKPRDHK